MAEPSNMTQELSSTKLLVKNKKKKQGILLRNYLKQVQTYVFVTPAIPVKITVLHLRNSSVAIVF